MRAGAADPALPMPAERVTFATTTTEDPTMPPTAASGDDGLGLAQPQDDDALFEDTEGWPPLPPSSHTESDAPDDRFSFDGSEAGGELPVAQVPALGAWACRSSGLMMISGVLSTRALMAPRGQATTTKTLQAQWVPARRCRAKKDVRRRGTTMAATLRSDKIKPSPATAPWTAATEPVRSPRRVGRGPGRRPGRGAIEARGSAHLGGAHRPSPHPANVGPEALTPAALAGNHPIQQD